MIVPFQGFVGGTFQGRTPKTASERCINWFPEPAAPNTTPKTPISFKRTPGKQLFARVGNGPIRDLFEQDGVLLVISGLEMYLLDGGGNATLLGSVSGGYLPAQTATNGTGGHQVMSVIGGKGYIYDTISGAFTQITDADFPSAAQGCIYKDSRFFTIGFNTISFYYSDQFNGLSWNGGGTAQKEVTTDKLRAIAESHTELWLFGNKTIEPWQDTGDSLVPFAPIQGVKIEHGIGPIGSLVKAYNTLTWLGQDTEGDRIAYLANAYEPVRISTHPIEELWRGYGQIDDATAWAYQEDGHTFYVLSFPSVSKTWAYDYTTNLWHERGYLNPSTGNQDADLARSHVFAFGKHLVGSRIDGSIYEQATTLRYDGGSAPIRRERIAPHLFKPGSDIEVACFQLFSNEGVAQAVGQGSDPQVMLRYSIDGGMTYSDELLAAQGKIGDYDRELYWGRLGSGPDWVFHLATSEPNLDEWTGAALDAI